MSRESNLRWNKLHPDVCREASRRYCERNRKLVNQKSRDYYNKNRERLQKVALAYHHANRDQRLEYNRAWKKENPEALRKHQRKQRSKPNAKLRHAISTRILRALKKGWKSDRTIELLGCSIANYKIYIESLWESGMTWENYGSEWHIDHIIPCAIFDLTKSEHQRRCFQFSNTQPMWATDNWRKNKHTTTNQFRLL